MTLTASVAPGPSLSDAPIFTPVPHTLDREDGVTNAQNRASDAARGRVEADCPKLELLTGGHESPRGNRGSSPGATSQTGRSHRRWWFSAKSSATLVETGIEAPLTGLPERVGNSRRERWDLRQGGRLVAELHANRVGGGRKIHTLGYRPNAVDWAQGEPHLTALERAERLRRRGYPVVANSRKNRPSCPPQSVALSHRRSLRAHGHRAVAGWDRRDTQPSRQRSQ